MKTKIVGCLYTKKLIAKRNKHVILLNKARESVIFIPLKHPNLPFKAKISFYSHKAA